MIQSKRLTDTLENDIVRCVVLIAVKHVQHPNR